MSDAADAKADAYGAKSKECVLAKDPIEEKVCTPWTPLVQGLLVISAMVCFGLHHQTFSRAKWLWLIPFCITMLSIGFIMGKCN